MSKAFLSEAVSEGLIAVDTVTSLGKVIYNE